MANRTLRIATRKSRLARWQAKYVAAALKRHFPEMKTELLPLSTTGDALADEALGKLGGKRLFVKELEAALLNGDADLAVHSMKDVPAVLPKGLAIAAVMRREEPWDAFVSNRFAEMDELPAGAVVGTSSLRRQCQLLHRRQHLTIRPLRGNLDTRLARLDDGNYDAIVLACAGLKRLQCDSRIRQRLSAEVSLPAIGQGAIGIECRADDSVVRPLRALHHQDTGDCVDAERAVNETLGGDCRLPIAAYAECAEATVRLKAIVGSPDGATLLSAEAASNRKRARQAGITAANKLLKMGAEKIINLSREG